MGEIFGEKFAKLITTTVINSKVSSKTTVDAIKRIFKVRFTGWNACMNTGCEPCIALTFITRERSREP